MFINIEIFYFKAIITNFPVSNYKMYHKLPRKYSDVLIYKKYDRILREAVKIYVRQYLGQ